jgi:hypothetical protein
LHVDRHAIRIVLEILRNVKWNIVSHSTVMFFVQTYLGGKNILSNTLSPSSLPLPSILSFIRTYYLPCYHYYYTYAQYLLLFRQDTRSTFTNLNTLNLITVSIRSSQLYRYGFSFFIIISSSKIVFKICCT